MARCQYKNCYKYRTTNPKFSLFNFPIKDEERCKQWIENAGLPILYPLTRYKNKGVCEDHFLREHFVNELKSRLIHTAVPIPWNHPKQRIEENCDNTPRISIRDDLFKRKTMLQLLTKKGTLTKNQFEWLDKLIHNRISLEEEELPAPELDWRKKVQEKGEIRSYSRKFLKKKVNPEPASEILYCDTQIKEECQVEDVNLEIETKNDCDLHVESKHFVFERKRKVRKRHKVAIITNSVRTSETEKFIFYMRASHTRFLKLKKELHNCRKKLRNLKEIKCVSTKKGNK